MQEEKREEEKIIDIKGTLAKFIEADEPELSQEEAIMKFGESNKKNSSDDENSENSEEQEHLKRVKKELLASLDRVEELAKKLYSEEEKLKRQKLKVKQEYGSSQGKSIKAKKEPSQEITNEKQKERE